MNKTTFCGLRPILRHKVLLASFFTTSLTCLFSLNSQIEVPRFSKILLVSCWMPWPAVQDVRNQWSELWLAVGGTPARNVSPAPLHYQPFKRRRVGQPQLRLQYCGPACLPYDPFDPEAPYGRTEGTLVEWVVRKARWPSLSCGWPTRRRLNDCYCRHYYCISEGAGLPIWPIATVCLGASDAEVFRTTIRSSVPSVRLIRASVPSGGMCATLS